MSSFVRIIHYIFYTKTHKRGNFYQSCLKNSFFLPNGPGLRKSDNINHDYNKWRLLYNSFYFSTLVQFSLSFSLKFDFSLTKHLIFKCRSESNILSFKVRTIKKKNVTKTSHCNNLDCT